MERKPNHPVPSSETEWQGCGRETVSRRLGPTSLFCVCAGTFFIFFKASYDFFQAASVSGFFNMKLVDPHNSQCNVCSWNSYLVTEGDVYVLFFVEQLCFAFLKKVQK